MNMNSTVAQSKHLLSNGSSHLHLAYTPCEIKVFLDFMAPLNMFSSANLNLIL